MNALLVLTRIALVKKLALVGITEMEEANRYLKEQYLPFFNEEFSVPSPGGKDVFVPWIGGDLDDILCEHHERVVNNNNCISFNSMILQIPEDDNRFHYVKTRVRVMHHMNKEISVFHGPRRLARYDKYGSLLFPVKRLSAVGTIQCQGR